MHCVHSSIRYKRSLCSIWTSQLLFYTFFSIFLCSMLVWVYYFHFSLLCKNHANNKLYQYNWDILWFCFLCLFIICYVTDTMLFTVITLSNALMQFSKYANYKYDLQKDIVVSLQYIVTILNVLNQRSKPLFFPPRYQNSKRNMVSFHLRLWQYGILLFRHHFDYYTPIN